MLVLMMVVRYISLVRLYVDEVVVISPIYANMNVMLYFLP